MMRSSRYIGLATLSVLHGDGAGQSATHSNTSGRNLAGCTDFTVVMSDSYGDGWNSNYLYFSNSISVTLSSGFYGTAVVCLEAGTYLPYACGGTWGSEVAWSVGGLSGSAGNTCAGTSGSFDVGPGPTAMPSFSPTACPPADEGEACLLAYNQYLKPGRET
jgi:hypothetical protein